MRQARDDFARYCLESSRVGDDSGMQTRGGIDYNLFFRLICLKMNNHPVFMIFKMFIGQTITELDHIRYRNCGISECKI